MKDLEDYYIEDVYGMDIVLRRRIYPLMTKDVPTDYGVVTTCLFDFVNRSNCLILYSCKYVKPDELYAHRDNLREYEGRVREKVKISIDNGFHAISKQRSSGVRFKLFNATIGFRISLNKTWVRYKDVGWEIRNMKIFPEEHMEDLHKSDIFDVGRFRIRKRKFLPWTK